MTLNYNDESNHIQASAGADTINSGGGNDTIYSGQGDDVANGQAGQDKIFGENGKDSIFGGEGDDALFGGAGNDQIDGGNGHDVIAGDGGTTLVSNGQAGRARIVIDGQSGAYNGALLVEVTTANGQTYVQTLTGSYDSAIGTVYELNLAGGDTIRIGMTSPEGTFWSNSINAVLNQSNQEWARISFEDTANLGDRDFDDLRVDVTLNGNVNLLLPNGGAINPAPGVLVAATGDDSITAGAGNDSVSGGGGQDTIYGGADDDIVFGEEGSDLLFGEAGRDRLFGGEGDDAVFGGAGNDQIDGGNGHDVIAGDGGTTLDGHDSITAGAGNDSVSGGGGQDTIYGGADDDIVFGEDGSDQLFGEAGRDRLFGGEGDDALFGGAGNDQIDGGNGHDVIAGDGGTTLDGHDSITAGAGNDSVSGGGGHDTIYGGADDDIVFGEAGNDQLFGEAGRDRLFGGEGDDTVFGANGFGVDSAEGGEAVEALGDTIDLSAMTDAAQVTFNGNESGEITAAGAKLSFIEFENLQLGSGADTVIASGTAGLAHVNTGAGADTVIHSYSPGAAEPRSYDGGADGDTFVLSFTAQQWATAAVQIEIAAYVAHLAAGNAAVPFTFASTNVTVTNFETFSVTVNGVTLDPANALVTANADSIHAQEDGVASIYVDLLANDNVPDRAANIQLLSGSSYGTLSLSTSLLDTVQTAGLVFTPNNALLQSLSQGQGITETLHYRVTDVDGNFADAEITITITGTNDAATITGTVAGAISENATTAIAGTLTVADVDTGEATFRAPSDLSGTYGTFSFDPATGNWSYTPNAGAAALESLAEGARVTDTLTVESKDGTASQTITITITGANDAPTLAAEVLRAQENGPSVSLDLANLADDVDSDDDASTLTYSIASGPSIGTASINGSTLSYAPGAGFQYLAAGETALVEIAVTATDSHGDSVTTVMNVEVTGTNDEVVILGNLQPEPDMSPNAAGGVEVRGGFTFSDLDLNDTHTVSAVDSFGNVVEVDLTVAATGGNVGTVNWRYDSTQNGGAPGSLQTVLVTVTDSSGSSVTQTITFQLPMTNGLADVSSPAGYFSDQDPRDIYNFGGVNYADLSYYYTDPDGDTLTASGIPGETYIGVTFNGTSTIRLENGNDAFQFLTKGQAYTYTFNFLVSDGFQSQVATFEWTIEGYRVRRDGSAGNDNVFGSASADLLNGGAGDDTLTSGSGNDVFAYMTAGDGFDLITDFEQGKDHIGVSAAAFGGGLVAGSDANVQVDTNFDIMSYNSGSSQGVFILSTDGTNGVLYWDADGGLADNAIAIARINGVTDLTSDDFFVFI